MQPSTSGPQATVLINNFNYGRYLTVAIESALAQTYPNLEVVVVDDGSTDDSRKVIDHYGSRIRAVFKPNGGQASTFNRGFAASHGQILCMLDSDDFFQPNKVDQVVEAFTSHPEIQWVFHPVCRLFDDGRKEVVPSLTKPIYSDMRAAALRGKLPGAIGPSTSGIALSRSLLERILPMPQSVTITADNYLIFLATALGPGVYLNDGLAVQRMHGRNRYTMRGDRILTQARIHLLIAHDMRQRFPQLWLLCNHIFSKALADYVRVLRRDTACEAIVAQYIKAAAPLELPDLLLRAGYHGVRRTLLRTME
jgi:glycosyltransferase involved in cell wall biosynthesis